MSTIKTIKLGNQGLEVPAVGLGCMGMTKIAHMDIYGQADEAEAIATIHRSLELGGNFLDTADLYGPLLNERLVAKAIRQLAKEKSITASQLALAWVMAKGIVPIPGTKRRKYVEENIAATAIHLSAEELARLEAIVPLGTVTGDRYDAAGMAMVGL